MKIFQKNHPPPKKGHLGGGGVMILNVVFAGFDAAWLSGNNQFIMRILAATLLAVAIQILLLARGKINHEKIKLIN